jgi:type I restriction enzyme, S subunit
MSGIVSWVTSKDLRHRLDADFYRPEYLSIDHRAAAHGLPLRPVVALSSLVTDGTHKTPAYVDSGVPFLSAKNIAGGFVNASSGHKYVSANEFTQLKRWNCAPEADDVLVAKSGSIGSAGLARGAYPEYAVFESVAIIRPRGVRPSYLSAFLNSRLGQLQIRRHSKGAVIRHLHLEDLREVDVPLPDQRVQDYIGAKIELAERCRSRAGGLRAEAVSRFDALLKLPAFRPGHELTNVIEASALTDRLSGEFYLPRYFALDAHLASLAVPVKPVSSLLRSDILRSFTPERSDDAPVPCILTSDIDPHDIRWRSPSLRVTQSVHDGHAGRLAARDVVYTSVGPPVGEAALVLPQFLPMAAGGDVSILRHGDDLHPGFLALYLNSVFGQMQNDRYSRGIRQRRVYPEDIGSFLIPVFSPEDQEYVGERIVRHQVLNELAVDFVNEATADVEALIEGTLDVDGIFSAKIESPAEGTIPELSEANA